MLSDPDRRAEYDATYKKDTPPPVPLSNSIDFMDTIDGELNRRLAVLALLYIQRRINPYSPEVSLAEVEMRMGFPRDYLSSPCGICGARATSSMADNSDFTLTALGVDFVESNRQHVPVLNKLLTSGPATAATDGVEATQAPEARQLPHGLPTNIGGSAGAGKNGEYETSPGYQNPADLPTRPEQVPVGATA